MDEVDRGLMRDFVKALWWLLVVAACVKALIWL